MTTEIAIMNKSAIALAADSAATVSTAKNNFKTYNTANKVFALSKYAPVGIMIYGNSDLTGIPWETIIKMYRENLLRKRFNKLEDYCDDFFKFLDNMDLPIEAEEKYIESQTFNILRYLQGKLDCDFVKHKKEDVDRVRNQLGKVAEQIKKELIEIANDSRMNDNEREELKDKYNKIIKDELKIYLKNFSPGEDVVSNLVDAVILAASIGPSGISGIVITGFGEKDIFPSCFEYDVAAVLKSKTIMRKKSVNKISIDNTAVILPFAQSDDVHNFIQGINPKLQDFLINTFSEHINEALPNTLLIHLTESQKFDEEEEKQHLEKLEDICRGVTNTLFDKLAKEKQVSYIKPVVDATCFLNKSELASMAEALVNMVSFRKQVTMEAETVGGPIDVLIITKGDGPIWIKRKHYFTPELNHHFFSNYLKMEEKNGKDTDA